MCVASGQKQLLAFVFFKQFRIPRLCFLVILSTFSSTVSACRQHFIHLCPSGDMDFAADIADFKRRMFLSVILLHRFNDILNLRCGSNKIKGYRCIYFGNDSTVSFQSKSQIHIKQNIGMSQIFKFFFAAQMPLNR